jgi:hypothetical protein
LPPFENRERSVYCFAPKQRNKGLWKIRWKFAKKNAADSVRVACRRVPFPLSLAAYPRGQPNMFKKILPRFLRFDG